MRRHGNLWQEITSPENIQIAYKKAILGKSKMRSVIKFNKNVQAMLERIRISLIERTFITAKYTEKTVYEPKKRIIYVLPFAPDRIVQHSLMRVVEPIWSKLFIHDSYACIVGKGIHKGSKRTMEFVRQNNYCLKCDVSKFYPSVDQEILFNIMLKLSKCDVFPVTRGVDFLGYRHFDNYILLRKSTTKRVRRRIQQLPLKYAKGRITAEQFRSSVGSTWGWLKHANCHNLMVNMDFERMSREVKKLV